MASLLPIFKPQSEQKAKYKPKKSKIAKEEIEKRKIIDPQITQEGWVKLNISAKRGVRVSPRIVRKYTLRMKYIRIISSYKTAFSASYISV